MSIKQIQAVKLDDTYRTNSDKPFSMIDNYIYLYHTDTLIALPLFPDSIQDTIEVQFSPQHPMSRSAPIYSYSQSGPRSMQISLPLHRDMMEAVNIDSSSMFHSRQDEILGEDYVDRMINQLQSAALPRYGAAQKMVDPPIVAVRFGNSIFCKGVVNGPVTAAHEGPILENNKYAVVNVSFTINEVDPYDAETVALEGGFRGLRTTLERRLFGPSPVTGANNFLTPARNPSFVMTAQR